MSKIGKKPIQLPSGVQVNLDGSMLTVKGAKGTLTKQLPVGISISVADNTVLVALTSQNPSRSERAQWGLWRALVSNMITGVSEGWTENLEFQGVGYKAAVKGSNLELSLGYSHPITVEAPEGITFTTDKTSIKVSGIDKELVGHVAADIRTKRLPEPYKGSGIRYSDEVIKKKAGKKAATAA
jgi:large subunit ribosomal protein L6